ncbi:MAG: hypothetical protein COU25_00815 [Candidatus Levybacteria bacterium CG10_big_fil_rev_8_21_14_0_10_35_13]|nr:MAG: hypothetical protein COU25_00815 [Candidatus Levybacteria bacterium CG10_big_fil_rev_8_21_14_0_10_35_13]
MAKRRKTREQKKSADLRHKILHKTVNYGFDPEPLLVKNGAKSSSQITSENVNYSYLIHDLTKTITLTAVIIGVQVFLFLLLKTHLINIPWIS